MSEHFDSLSQHFYALLRDLEPTYVGSVRPHLISSLQLLGLDGTPQREMLNLTLITAAMLLGLVVAWIISSIFKGSKDKPKNSTEPQSAEITYVAKEPPRQLLEERKIFKARRRTNVPVPSSSSSNKDEEERESTVEVFKAPPVMLEDEKKRETEQNEERPTTTLEQTQEGERGHEEEDHEQEGLEPKVEINEEEQEQEQEEQEEEQEQKHEEKEEQQPVQENKEEEEAEEVEEEEEEDIFESEKGARKKSRALKVQDEEGGKARGVVGTPTRRSTRKSLAPDRFSPGGLLPSTPSKRKAVRTRKVD